MADYRYLMKAGPLRNGYERGGGAVFHAVPASAGPVEVHGFAVCGTAPSIMWSGRQGEKVTGPRCIKKLTKLEGRSND